MRWLHKILKSKLNSGNLIKAFNTQAVSLFRYGEGTADWNQPELENMNKRIKKLLHAYGVLHPRADVDRLYVQREQNGRGLIIISVWYEEQNMITYTNDKNTEIMTTIHQYTGKQIEGNRKIFGKKQRNEA